MNILLDVDDTLTDFLAKRNRLIKTYITKKGLPYKILNMHSSKSANVANWPLSECENFWHEIGRDVQLNCNPQAGCVKVVQELKKQGHRIIIVTARPDNYYEALPYTKTWLDKNSIPYDLIITGKFDKKQTMIDNKIQLAIDDSIDTIRFADELGISSILYTSIENKDKPVPNTCTRVHDWQQIYEILLNHVNK